VFRKALGSIQPPIHWVPRALSLGVKRPVCEADHSPPTSAEVKNARSYTSTPQYVFMAWCLVKHMDNFTFTFTFLNTLIHLQDAKQHGMKIYENKLLRGIFGPNREETTGD
jgi:hypothetical protein